MTPASSRDTLLTRAPARRLRQILHYQPMEKYEPHWDYFVDPVNTGNGGQRLATMLMYLSDVEEGGETVFPNSPEKPVPRPAAAAGLHAARPQLYFRVVILLNSSVCCCKIAVVHGAARCRSAAPHALWLRSNSKLARRLCQRFVMIVVVAGRWLASVAWGADSRMR